MSINERIEGFIKHREDLLIRDFSPHFNGDWKAGAEYELGTIQKLSRGEGERASLSYDDEERAGKISEPCGCCGEEAGFEFRFTTNERTDMNLAQL